MVEGLRDSTQSIPTFVLDKENQSTIKIQTYISGSPPKSDGADETGDESRILVWVTPRTTGRGGHMKIASIQTQPVTGQNIRRAAKRRAGGRPAGDQIPEETGRHRDSRWDIPRKRALFTSDGPDSTTSGSGHSGGPLR